jgi:hypothetical protein
MSRNMNAAYQNKIESVIKAIAEKERELKRIQALINGQKIK